MFGAGMGWRNWLTHMMLETRATVGFSYRQNTVYLSGICEPIDDAECKNINEDIMFESAEPFNCPATNNSGNVKTKH